MVGAAAPWSAIKGGLWNGIELATKEVNQGGGILGRTMRIVKRDEEASVVKGQLVAQEFVDEESMVAVLSHSSTAVETTTAIMYEVHGVLHLALSSSERLTQHGFRRVFRCLPGDAAVGSALARFAREQGYGRIAIYHLRSEHGEGVANALERDGRSIGLRVVDRMAHDAFDRPTKLAWDLAHFRDSSEFDALLLAGAPSQAAQVMRVARSQGLEVPILGGQTLDTEALLAAAGEAAEGVHVCSVFDPDSSTPEVRGFVETFEREYGTTPDAMAAIGYDSVRLLAAGIDAAGTTVPDEIATALRSLQDWEGVTGQFSFDDRGNRVSPAVFVKVVEDGRFRRVELQ